MFGTRDDIFYNYWFARNIYFHMARARPTQRMFDSRWKILTISQILILQRLSRVYRMRDDYRLRCTIIAVLDDKRVIIAGSSSYRTIIVMLFSYRTIIVMSSSYRTIIVMSSSYRTIIVMSSSYRTIIVISSSYCTMIVMSYCYCTMILISDCDLTIIDNISKIAFTTVDLIMYVV